MVEAEAGPLKVTFVPSPIDCGLMVPERRNVSEVPEPGETTPAQPQRDTNNGSNASEKARHFGKPRDFVSVQRRDRYIK
jgi:hypothetical protein